MRKMDIPGNRKTALIAAAAIFGAALLPFSSACSQTLRGGLALSSPVVEQGGYVTITLTISGKGNPAAFVLEQPALPPLRRLELVGVDQKNEISASPGGESFDFVISYKLKAKETGEQKIPTFNVKYKKGDDVGAVPVEGTRITINRSGRGPWTYAALAVAATSGASAFVLFRRLLSKRRAIHPRA